MEKVTLLSGRVVTDEEYDQMLAVCEWFSLQTMIDGQVAFIQYSLIGEELISVIEHTELQNNALDHNTMVQKVRQHLIKVKEAYECHPEVKSTPFRS